MQILPGYFCCHWKICCQIDIWTIKYYQRLNFFPGILLVRIRIPISNSRITDPDPGGHLITDPSDPYPQQCYPCVQFLHVSKGFSPYCTVRDIYSVCVRQLVLLPKTALYPMSIPMPGYSFTIFSKEFGKKDRAAAARHVFSWLWTFYPDIHLFHRVDAKVPVFREGTVLMCGTLHCTCKAIPCLFVNKQWNNKQAL